MQTHWAKFILLKNRELGLLGKLINKSFQWIRCQDKLSLGKILLIKNPRVLVVGQNIFTR